MYDSENIYGELNNDKQKQKHKHKLRCLYHGYMSDFAILVSLVIFAFYIYNVKNDTKDKNTYSKLIENFPNNNTSKILFVAEALYLLFSAYTSFVHKVHKYSTAPQFLIYSIIIFASIYETNKKDNKNLGLSPLLVIPITIAMFFHNIPESYRNRKCQ